MPSSDWISRYSGDPTKNNFGDVSQYPKTLVVGDDLFPLLYIYFIGDKSRVKRVYNVEVYEEGLRKYVEKTYAMNPGNTTSVDNAIKNINTQVQRFSQMLDNALDLNEDFVWALKQKANALLGVYRARIPHLDINTTGKKYYTSKDKQVVSRVPVMLNGMSSFETADAALEVLRILLENNIISPEFSLGIRPINLYDGSSAEISPDQKSLNDMMRNLGLPTNGAFTVNKVPRSSWMYHTFSGVDLTALASIGDAVSPLDGLTTFSWSTHMGKQTQRTLGKSAPSGRAKGNRTIAGTMIFAASDHHPLLKIVPSDFPVAQAAFVSRDPSIWKPLMMADEIPPFDLVLVAQNEYGFASATSIYGIEITDEGVTLGIDNLITEIVLQYTAVAMDPIQEIPANEEGVIDPFGMMSVKTSNLHRRRETIIAGAGDMNLEDKWTAHNDAVFAAISTKIQRRR